MIQIKLKIWYKDGEFPEPEKGYEEFEVRAEHSTHNRIAMLKNNGEIVVDEKLDEESSQIRSIPTKKILQARLVAEKPVKDGEGGEDK